MTGTRILRGDALLHRDGSRMAHSLKPARQSLLRTPRASGLALMWLFVQFALPLPAIHRWSFQVLGPWSTMTCHATSPSSGGSHGRRRSFAHSHARDAGCRMQDCSSPSDEWHLSRPQHNVEYFISSHSQHSSPMRSTDGRKAGIEALAGRGRAGLQWVRNHYARA